jgi:trk system potassium uptake protein TrkH
MGILMFVLAFLPQKDMQSMHIMRAEVPGPSVGKLVSKTTVTARILYIIYAAFTLAEIVALLCCDMPLFDSITTAFATAGTGGFSVKNASIAAYNSLPIEIICTFFMLLFGINFNLFYLILIKQFRRAIKSEELWTYLGIIAISIGIITFNIAPLVDSFGTALRQAGFQVVSVITTTGFITADFNTWPMISQVILITLMFIGACGGSTGGGMKVARLGICAKTTAADFRKLIHPRSVTYAKFEGQVVLPETERNVKAYLTLWVGIVILSTLLLSLDFGGLYSNFSATLACIGNVGPGFEAVGPTMNYGFYSSLSKCWLSLVMLIGRLEIFPMLFLFIPSTWKKG